jgi:NAD(P)-dependent dehydrogenase (short-subunit alcohol dehydrogenase family)
MDQDQALSVSVATPEDRRVLILTGASRGIGHATVKRFSSAGWRVISCSRHPFPEDCPWEAGEEDHIQVDLADPDDVIRAVAEMKLRLRVQKGRLHALVNNAAISPKGAGGSRLSSQERRTRSGQAVQSAPGGMSGTRKRRCDEAPGE